MAGLFTTNTAWGQWFASCSGNENVSILYPPQATLTITHSAVSGTLVGNWVNYISADYFVRCAPSKTAVSNIGENERMYVIGVKPPLTEAAPGNLQVSDGGQSYRVFTTPALKARRLGYIIRWAARTTSGEQGPWRTPANNWPQDDSGPSGHPQFFRGLFTHNHCFSGQLYNQFPSGFPDMATWMTYRDADDTPNGCFFFAHRVRLQWRYVVIDSDGNSELERVQQTLVTELAAFRGNMESGGDLITFRHTVNVTLPPWGTCKTPSAEEATVNFNTILATELSQPGSASAYKPFTLTFSNCPRVSIGWHVHANGKWVNSAQGIVGLSGSAPNANPAIGNPRGIGIQLAHDGGVHGSGEVYISPTVNDPNRQVYLRTPAQGTDSPVGVTHVLPLRARVIRTNPADTPITPGPFNTSVIFVIQYP